MAPRKQWGKTPWGGAFLNALESIDVASSGGGGRLKRGKTIANTNKVLNFTVKGYEVTARVQGSYSPYYNIRIGFNPFTAAQRAAILRVVQANPIHLGSVMNGTLPPDLLRAIETDVPSISLLPSKWADMSGDCTCPDYSSSFTGSSFYSGGPRPAGCPCKHMAGTFYVIVGEMDKDPFLVFKLRGLDVQKELALQKGGAAGRGSGQGGLDTAVPYPLTVSEWTAAKPMQDDTDDATAEHHPNPNELSLRSIRPCSGFILSNLSPNPAFSRHIDFHTALKECFAYMTNPKKMSKSCALSPKAAKGVNIDDLEGVAHFSRLTMHLQPNNFVASLQVQNDIFADDTELVSRAFSGFPNKHVKSEVTMDAKTTLSLLPSISLLPRGGSESLRFFWWAARLARHLLAKGAVVPDILPSAPANANNAADGSNWLGIWRPLATNVDVDAAMNDLTAMHPVTCPCVFLVEDEDDSTSTTTGKSTGEVDENFKPLSPRSAAEHVLTVFCTKLVHAAGFVPKERRVSPPRESRAFFSGETFQVQHASERSMAKAIHRYFSVFSLLKTDFQIELRVHGSPPESYILALLFDDVPLNKFLKKVENDPKKRRDALKILSHLTPPLPGPLNGLVHTEEVPLCGGDLQTFILGASSTLRTLGVRTVVPKELSKALRPRLVLAPKEDSIRAADTSSNAKSVLTKLSLVQFEWRVAVGDTTLTQSEFRKLAESRRGVVMYKSKFVEIDAAQMSSMMAQCSQDPSSVQPSPTDILQAALLPGESEALTTIKGSTNLWIPPSTRELIQSGMATANEASSPESLRAELRPYQLQGFRWLAGLVENGFGAILADDMGLGKTLQTLTLLLHLQWQGHFQSLGPALIVMPTALLFNWTREAKRFSPSLRTFVYHGNGRNLPSGTTSSSSNGQSAAVKRLKTGSECPDLVLTTYGTLRSDKAKLKKARWGAIIIDEAQQIKNPASAQTKAVKDLNAPVKVALSGTPVENKLSEMWSIFDFALPKFLGTLKQFNKEYAKPIEADSDETALEKFRNLTAPFLLRRMKTDEEICGELPDKIVTDQLCKLQPEQAALYQTVVDEVTAELSEGSGRSAKVLTLISSLKQVCNHPHNYFPDKYGADGSLSGKCEMLSEIINPILESGEQVLIFTQYVRMLTALVERIIPERHNVKPLPYHGGMSTNARDAAVRRFQRGDVPIMVVSLKAGGVGLNLTAANHAIMFDLWWNPAVESQAIDRCFRIGQTRTVFVHRFITHGTFEEKINEMIAKKRELSDMSVSKGENWLGDLSNEELIGILQGNDSGDE